MKKIISKNTKLLFLLILFSISIIGYSDPPGPPGGSSGTGNIDDNRNGRGAPIGSGLLLLIGLGGIYGGYKIKKVKSVI